MGKLAIRRGFLMLGVLLPTLSGCGGSPSGPSDSGYTVSGSWGGRALLPNSVGSEMILQQNASNVTGTMRINGAFRDRPLTGTFTTSTRVFVWNVNNDCEVWSGQLTLDPSGQELSGTIRLSAAGCGPSYRDASGTLSLSR